MKQHIALVLVISGLILGGCTQHLQPLSQNKKYESKHVLDKSYTINVQQTAFIGESMIRVKDYNIVEKMSDKLKASEDFIFNNKWSFQKGEIFELEGQYLLNGKYYNVIKHPTFDFSRLLVDEEGVIQNKIIGWVATGGYVKVIYTYEYRPTSIRLLNEKITETTVNKGSLNYELVYTGKDKDSLKLFYREYTSEDMARPSFYQTLTYDLDSKKIRFKNITMQVNLLDNEKITFTVISDT